MWDSFLSFPRGRLSTRNFVMFFATLIVASFGYLFVAPTSVGAIDGTWDGDTLTYDNKVFKPTDIKNARGLGGIPQGAQVYQYAPQGAGNKTVELIYFKSGEVPKSAKEATYIVYTLNPPNTYSAPTGEKTVTLVPATEEEPENDEDSGALGSSCTIDGIGWMVCPIMNALAEGMDIIYSMISGYLRVQILTTDDDSPIYRTWSVIRDLANIAFVIAIMVMIYSHLTSIGLSNYSLKKLLPRIIIAAVAVNISYIICSVAVDLSNILGYSTNALFEQIRDDVLPGSASRDISWSTVVSFVLSGGAAAGGGAVGLSLLTVSIAGAAGGLWYIIAPLLLGAFLVVIVTFLILAARQAIIVILIALAPLAFVAYLLPNTEKWFEKWRSLLFTMLIMFPAFAAVFGGAQLAGELIIRTAATLEQVVLGLGVMVAPLAITPLLLKLGGGVLNRFAGIVNNPSKGFLDRYKNYNKDRLGEHQAKNNAINSRLREAGGFQRRQFMRRHASADYAKKQYRETQKKTDEEAAENYWHRQTGRWGYDNHGARDTVRNRVGMRQNGYGNLDTYKRDNKLDHDQTEAHHEEHWQDLLHGDATRRAIQTNTRLSQGRGKVLEESLADRDERTLQTLLNTDAGYANLRNLKVHSAVDKGVAEVQKGEIDSSGKLALSNAIDASRDLRTMKVRTHENEKRAETIDNTLKKNAEAHWDYISRTDDATRALRLREVKASDKAKLVEEEYNTMIENIAAKGAAAPNIALGDAAVANAIMGARQGLQIEAKAQDAAKVQQGINLMVALKESQEAIIDPTAGGDPALLKRAAGIGGQQAEARIFAQATKTVVDAAVQEVKDDRYLLNQYTRSQLHAVLFEGKGLHGEKVTTEMQQAAMYELLQKKGNNDDAQVVRNAIRDMGMVVDETTGKFYEPQRDNSGRVVLGANNRPVADLAREITDNDEVGRRRDWQQFFTDAAKDSPHSQVTLSGTDRSDAEAGTLLSGIQDAFMRDALGGKFGPEKMLKADIDELKFLYTDMVDPNGEYQRLSDSKKAQVNKAVTEAVLALQKHPTYKGQIDDRNRGVMNQIVALADPSYSGGVDQDGKPLFYVDADNSLIQPPAQPTGTEKTFSAPVPGNLPAIRRGPDWEISRNW